MQLLCASALFMAMTIPAYSHWEYTRWGMSPSEVVRSSKGKAYLVPESLVRKADPLGGRIKLVQSQTTLSGIRLNVAFIFDIKAVPQLRRVALYKDGCTLKEFVLFEDHLSKLYGPPLRGNSSLPSVMRTLTWFDDKNDNWVESYIRLTGVPSCSIRLRDRMDNSD